MLLRRPLTLRSFRRAALGAAGLLALTATAGIAQGPAGTIPGEDAGRLASAEAHPTDEPGSLPIYLTPEERTRLHEIGATHRGTAPPPGPVRNCAEWEPVIGVLIRYPLGLPWDLIRDYADHTTVYCLVSSSLESSAASNFTANGVDMSNVEFLVMGTNSIWTRDYGPWFVFDGNDELGISDHVYNRPRPLDDQVNWNLGPIFGVNVFGHDLLHTGGNYMTDGHGIAWSSDLVTEENDDLSVSEIEAVMADYLGIHTYHVMPRISSSGIHHIDTWAKLLDEETVIVKEVSSGHPDYEECEETAQIFSTLTNCYGRPFDVMRVYCPSIGGSNVAAYTNGIVLNDRMYVPVFNISADDEALATFEAAMPGYDIVGYDGSWLTDDAIHCRGKGIMDPGMLYLDHDPIQGAVVGEGDVRVVAYVKSHADEGLDESSVELRWRIEGAPSFGSLAMTRVAVTDSFEVMLPEQSPFTTVEYYVTAADASSGPRVSSRPWVAPDAFYAFEFGPGVVGVDETLPGSSPGVALTANPFRTGTRVLLGDTAAATVRIYGADGRELRTLEAAAGAGSLAWDGRDATGRTVPPGVYFLAVERDTSRQILRAVRVP